MAKGKKINIDLATTSTDEDYNFYQFDKGTGQWQEIAKTTAVKNENKKRLKDSIAAIKITEAPELPAMASKTGLILDLNLDYSKFPQLGSYFGVVWQYNGPDKELVKQQLQDKWTRTNLTAKTTSATDFELQLVSKNNTLTLPVTPILDDRQRASYEAAFKKRQEEYIRLLANSQRLSASYENEASFVRKLSVTGVGIYNCDRLIQYEQPVVLDYLLNLDGKPFTGAATVYLASANNSAVKMYPGYPLRFERTRKNYLMVVLPEDRVAFVRPEQLIHSAERDLKTATFNLTVHPNPVTTVEELKHVMETI